MEKNKSIFWQVASVFIILAIIILIITQAGGKKILPQSPIPKPYLPVTKYITPIDWPPKVQIINEPFSCLEAGRETDRAGETTLQNISGRKYCVTKISEGAAGSTYIQYAYATAKDENTTEIFTFSLKFVQCGNYDEPNKSECEKERREFSANEIFESPNSVGGGPNIVVTQICYIWNTEAGDKAQLSMDIREGDVVGEFNWLPAERDKKVGIFKGTVSTLPANATSRIVNAWWETHAEGMTVTEELRIIFDPNVASIGFGEMKDRGDGVYIYADPKHISYQPNLQETDCGDEAMD